MDYTFYFQNGKLFSVYPKIRDLYENRELLYDARYIYSDDRWCDLENIENVRSIRIPKYHTNTDSIIGACGYLEYVLRMKSGKCEERGDVPLALALLKKACDLMCVSNTAWGRSDFRQYPTKLRKHGYFDEADAYDAFLEEKQPNGYNSDNLLQSKNFLALISAEQLGLDLVEVSSHSPTCAECSAWQGRVYSISGNDKRFPPLPDHVRSTGLFHDGCRHTLNPVAAIDEFLIERSNRPFVDSRSDQEKDAYTAFIEQRSKEEQDYQQSKADLRKRWHHLQVYNSLCSALPDLAPKSYSAYMRARNSRSKSFCKLAEEAAKLNIDVYKE